MSNQCDNCNNFHCYKSSRFDRYFGYCSVKGMLDDNCEKFTPRTDDYKTVIEESEVPSKAKMSELFWGFDAQLNLCNPDYGKEAENENKKEGAEKMNKRRFEERLKELSQKMPMNSLDNYSDRKVLTKNNQDSNQGDLISREALKKAIDELFFVDEYTVEKVIDNAPTVLHDNYSMGYQDGVRKVLSEKPQGEWIITGEEQGALGITYKIRKCDKCGWEHSLVIPDNFCPNCGADMRKGEEE